MVIDNCGFSCDNRGDFDNMNWKCVKEVKTYKPEVKTVEIKPVKTNMPSKYVEPAIKWNNTVHSAASIMEHAPVKTFIPEEHITQPVETHIYKTPEPHFFDSCPQGWVKVKFG